MVFSTNAQLTALQIDQIHGLFYQREFRPPEQIIHELVCDLKRWHGVEKCQWHVSKAKVTTF